MTFGRYSIQNTSPRLHTQVVAKYCVIPLARRGRWPERKEAVRSRQEALGGETKIKSQISSPTPDVGVDCGLVLGSIDPPSDQKVKADRKLRA